jgi:hypothetical protein
MIHLVSAVALVDVDGPGFLLAQRPPNGSQWRACGVSGRQSKREKTEIAMIRGGRRTGHQHMNHVTKFTDIYQPFADDFHLRCRCFACRAVENAPMSRGSGPEMGRTGGSQYPVRRRILIPPILPGLAQQAIPRSLDQYRDANFLSTFETMFLRFYIVA